jgi:hypothetical protein
MQQVIDGILYSPVLAHALRRGDLIELVWGTCRVTANPSRTREFIHVDAVDIEDNEPTWLKFWINEPVLRAVGAGTSGVL